MSRWFLSGSIVLAVILTSFGCSSGDKPAATPAVIVVTATPAPAETKPADTKPASTPAAAPASTPATAANTPTPSQAGPQRIEAHALWVSRKDGKYDGGTSRIRVNVEKTGSAKELRVGFFEEEVGGSGPMWRASGWMAVIMSSLLLGVDPAQYKYSYDVGGSIDGPSAGALMTVSTMAALLGDTVKSDAAMTGTINPDGTIGPVGGIPHKIDGAAAAGKKLVLVPAGSRRSTDSNTNTSVDVVERGRSKNVDIKEVADVYEAYELLTGKPLPKAPGAKEVRPELPSTSFERVRAKAKEWYTRYWQLDSQYNALPAAIRQESFDSMMNEAAEHGKKSDDYYKQGMASAGYSQALSATLKASVAFQAAKVVEAYVNGRMKSASAYLDSLSSVRLKSDAFLDRLQTQQVKTLGDLIAVSDAYGYANLAVGLIDMGNAAAKRQTKTEEEALTALAEASLYYAIAEHTIELAKDAIDVGAGYGKAPVPPQEQVEALAELLRRAADANLNYFNSVVVDGIAQEAGVHPDVVKAKFGSQEMSYTFAYSSLNNLESLKKRAGTGPSGSYATLGGAMSSYLFSSGLVAKYYSLGAKVDQNGEMTGVTNERAMINMLDLAEKRAKEAVGLAVSLDVEPVQPVLYFEDAKVSREGKTGDKLDALQSYWRTSLEGQIIGMLSGKARLVKQ